MSTNSNTAWTQQEAIELCKQVEPLFAKHGFHVALTGGCLYGGTMKDCDLIVYSVRQNLEPNHYKLAVELEKFGFEYNKQGNGWVTKVQYKGKEIDLLYPETNKTIYDVYPEALQDNPELLV
jgi:hypothetical protein